MKKKRLGRGLGSLIGNIDEVTGTHDADRVDGMIELDIDRIQRGRYQPRQVFEPEALQELADSIRAQGVVQPIVVRPEGNHFELVEHFGDRVYRTVIPRNVALAEAPSFGQSILKYNSKSRGSMAYLSLAGEILRRAAKQNHYVNQ